MKKGNKKLLTVIFFVGITMLLCGYILNFLYGTFYTDETIELDDIPVFDTLLRMPPLFVWMLTILLAPIVEEFVFRIWVKGNGLTQIISLVGINLMIYLGLGSLVVLVIGLVLSLAIVLLRKRFSSSSNLIIMIAFTSLCFGLIHWNNYGDTFMRIVSLSQLAGLGIMLAVIGIKFGWFFCIIGHVVFNLIPTTYLSTSSERELLKIENASYSAELKPLSIFEYSYDSQYLSHDTLTIHGSLTSIAANLGSLKDSENIFLPKMQNLNKFQLTVIAKQDEINYRNIFQEYISELNLAIDSMSVNGYTADVDMENIKLKSNCEACARITFEALFSHVESQSGNPVSIEDSLKNTVVWIHRDFMTEMELDRKLEILNDFGIELKLNEQQEFKKYIISE